MRKMYRSSLVFLISLCLLFSGFLVPTHATQIREGTAISDPTILIRLNDENIISRDVNGNPVFPLIYQGSTYLPVRGVSQAAGLIPDWIQATKTVTLVSDPQAALTHGSREFTEPDLDIASITFTTIQEVESNNDRESAQILTTLPIRVQGTIGDRVGATTDNTDYYQFTVSGEGLVVITLENPMEVNAKVALYGIHASASIASDSTGIFETREIRQILKAGDYLIRVYNPNDAGSYTLKIAELPLPIQTEDNDDRETAFAIGLNERHFGYVGSKDAKNNFDNNDYYSFELTKAQYVTLNTTSLESVNVKITLYSENATASIATDTNGIHTNRFINRELQPGKYYIRVGSPTNAGFYSLRLDAVEPATVERKNVTITERPDFTIIINGEVFTARDVGGNIIYPILVDGTTYLPVRAVGQAVGIHVGWDPSLRTVLMAHHPVHHLMRTVNNTYGAPVTVAETEPNNDRHMAQLIPLISKVSGTLGDKAGSVTDNNDYYRLSVPHEGVLTLTLDSDAGSNPKIALYGFHASSAIVSDSTGTFTTRTIEQVVLAGDYIIRVYNQTSPGAYTLKTNFEAFAQQGEPNDDRYEATVVEPVSTVSAYIGGKDASNLSDNNDYYKVTIFDQGTLTITITASTAVNPKLTLYTMTASSSIASDTYGIYETRTIEEMLQPGVYYIRVGSPVKAGAYQLDVNFVRN